MKNIIEITKDLIEITENKDIRIEDFKYSDCELYKNTLPLRKSISLSMTSNDIGFKNILFDVKKIADENKLEISNIEYSETVIERKIKVKLIEI